MRQNSYKTLISIVLFFSLCFLITTSAYAEYMIAQLTNNNIYERGPHINDKKQVAWWGWDGHDYEVFFYDGTAITNLTNNEYNEYGHSINNRGEVVWTGDDGNDHEIFLYDGINIKQITDNNYGDGNGPQINDNGEITWLKYEEAVDREIMLYDGTNVVQITDDECEVNTPKINNSGMLAFNSNCVPGYDMHGWDIFLYDGIDIIQLTDDDYFDATPQINDSGEIIWSAFDGFSHELYMYNGTDIIQITDNDFTWEQEPQINNSGEVVWSAYDGHDSEIFLYDGTSIIQLTDNDLPDFDPKLNDYGEIVWRRGSFPGSDYHEIFVYNGTTIIQLTDNYYKDWEPHINNNGDVVWTGEHEGDSEDYEIHIAYRDADDIVDVLAYTPVTPCRIVDTRKTSAGIIEENTQREFSVHGSAYHISNQGGNPAGCPAPLGEPLAAHISMSAVNPTGKGNLQAFPKGAVSGAGLSVNYNTIDTNLANAGTVKTKYLDGTDITVASNFSSAHTVIDVLGYYYPDGDFLFEAVEPCRIVDTRKSSAGIIDANTQREFIVHGPASNISAQGGNPAGCPAPLGEPMAAHIHMVAVDPRGKGNLQAFPKGASVGAGLSVNYNTIDTNIANAGSVKTRPLDGTDITVASNFSSAHTVIDVLGYYYPDGELSYTPVTPCRIADTRKSSAGIIAAFNGRDFHVHGSAAMISAQGGNAAGCLAPFGEPSAVHINMVAVDPTGKGNLQAFPMDGSGGAGLSVNYNTIDTNLANAGAIKTKHSDGTDIWVSSRFSSAHAVIDVLGYYYPAP